MSQALGSIFDDNAGSGSGIDLEYRTSLHPSIRQAGGRYAVPVPVRLDADGLMVERAQTAGESDGTIEVTLPADAPARFRLRLRGLGAKNTEDGSVGDLYLVLIEDPDAPIWARRDQLSAPAARSSASSGRIAVGVSVAVLLLLLLLRATGIA